MWHQKAKGPPDGPPIFLIFVEKLNCPQSQAYQSISPVGTGLSLTDRALGVSLGTSIGNYSPLIAPQPVKLKMRRIFHAGSSPATGTRLSLDALRVLCPAFSVAWTLAFGAVPCVNAFQINGIRTCFRWEMGSDFGFSGRYEYDCYSGMRSSRQQIVQQRLPYPATGD